MSEDYLGFVGTYTWDDSQGIYAFRIDPESARFETIGPTEAGENPSFLAIHPSEEYLYAVNETDPGGVTAFAIDTISGELERINSVESGDAGPCHCSVDATGSYVFIAHYGGGSISALPIHEDGRVGDPVQVVEHEGTSVDPERQTQPRPHSIVPGPNNRFVYVPDLGADRIESYKLDLDNGPLTPTEQDYVDLQPAAGPRHLDFHPNRDIAYLINEMDSTVTSFERDPETGALDAIETVSTLPAEFNGENSTADIHVHPSGNFVYGSNRGHDSIVILEIDEETGAAHVIDHESTCGETPRNFALDPSGSLLFAENQDTHDIYAFDITSDGTLDNPRLVADVPRPVCLKIMSSS